MNQRIDRSSLLSRFDQDAGPWRPMYYPLTLNVPLEAGQYAEDSITINNQPYIWMYIGHQILGNTWDWETTGLYQDGQYLLEVKDEQSNYQSLPIAAASAFGQGATGYLAELPFPIAFAGNKTITFRATSTYTRVLNPDPDPSVFRLHLLMCGVADWGVLTS